MRWWLEMKVCLCFVDLPDMDVHVIVHSTCMPLLCMCNAEHTQQQHPCGVMSEGHVMGQASDS
jgi:hypothetical protein